MALKVNKTPYKASHWKNPKGTGLWFFMLHRNYAATEFKAYGSFTEALKQAKSEAKALGCDTVSVQP